MTDFPEYLDGGIKMDGRRVVTRFQRISGTSMYTSKELGSTLSLPSKITVCDCREPCCRLLSIEQKGADYLFKIECDPSRGCGTRGWVVAKKVRKVFE